MLYLSLFMEVAHMLRAALVSAYAGNECPGSPVDKIRQDNKCYYKRPTRAAVFWSNKILDL